MDTTKYKFHKLTPSRDTKLKIYAEALDFVFRDHDLKNIAITGAYSSGKSSMLETYKVANKDKKFIHISLAHFESVTSGSMKLKDNSQEIGDNTKDIKEKDPNKKFEADIKSVEGKILNQLIHQIDTKEIPQTNFKIKHPFSIKRTITTSIIFTMFMAFLIFLFNRNRWIVFANGIEQAWLKFVLSPTTSDWFAVACIGVCGLVFLSGLFNILKTQHNKNIFKKLSVQGNEIEIFENDEDSFFDKHLNEVLYLFRNSKADAIVFEDMDRYNSNQIFEKLREINYLLNNNSNSTLKEKTKILKYVEKLKQKFLNKRFQNESIKTFRFFYLLRDDIFTSKDRTKFFDFIIPIVPIIDGANSYDKFIQYFKEGNILEQFDSSFLQEISMYIDDMRLLKNIYNEYQVYYDRIQGTTKLNCNKLLGMVVYKNLFPRDFSELQLGKGYVFCLFRQKEKFIEVEIKNINKQIENINSILIRAEQEQLNDLNELDALFLVGDRCIYDVDGKESSQFQTIGEFIGAMKENPENVYSSSSYHGRSHNRQKINIMSEFERFLSMPEYVKRKEVVEAKTVDKRNIIQDELNLLNNQKMELENATLSEIIQISKEMASMVFASIYIDEINVDYNYEDVKSSLYFPLIKYLVRNKWIDENYPEYMSYFHEQSISRIDQIFIRSVFDVEVKPFNYTLNNAALVSSKISSRYYSQPEVLNFDLFESLLKIQNENLITFIEQLRDNHRLDFIIRFWEKNKEKPSLFRNINKIWPGIWYELSTDEVISAESKNKYLIDTFYYSSHADIGKMNIENVITKYISSCDNFLSVSGPKVIPIVDALEFLEIRFIEINYEVSDKELFKEIYLRNLYEINIKMIFLIIKEVYEIPESDDYYHKNYSLLMTKIDEPLTKHINNNMNSYLDIIISICNGEIGDDEEHAVAILNHSKVERKYKENYIDMLTTEIENLTSVNDCTLWPLLLNYHCVPCSKENIFRYYLDSGNSFDDTLTNFINTSELEKDIKYNDILEQYGKEQTSNFYKSVVTNNALENNKYNSILLGFNRLYTQFSFTDIDKEKIKILIELKIIKMNVNNLVFIRENYETCKVFFIINNIDEYVKSAINEDSFDISELKYLLKEKVSDENLLDLLGFTDEQISIEGINVSDSVKKYIIENNYYKDDLQSLVSSYEINSPELKQILLDLCIREFNYIIENNIKVPYNLLVLLLQPSRIPDNSELLAIQLVNLTKEQAIKCFTVMGMNNLLTVFKGKWPSIEIHDTNTSILEIMKTKRWISSFTEDKDKAGYYRVRARRAIHSNNELPDHLL